MSVSEGREEDNGMAGAVLRSIGYGTTAHARQSEKRW